MLFLLLLILGCLWIGYCYTHQKRRLLTLGTFCFAKTISHHHQQYDIEEVAFSDYQGAIHGYFRLVSALQAYGEVKSSDYDFFDFYSVVLQFDDCTMRSLRRIDRVRLIKSHQPMSIDEFKREIETFAYQSF